MPTAPLLWIEENSQESKTMPIGVLSQSISSFSAPVSPDQGRPSSASPSGSSGHSPGSAPLTSLVLEYISSIQSALEKFDSSWDIIRGATDFAATTRQLSFPCFFLEPHSRTKDFFPRPEISRLLEETLLPSIPRNAESRQENLKSFVLCGLGGVGKTEIALDFVFSNLQHYDAVFIVHADQSSRLAEEYCQIAVKLGLEQQGENNDPAISRENVLSWLANPVKSSSSSFSPPGAIDSSPIHSVRAKWLLVFDNADDPTVLDDYFPTNGYGSVLVTSQDPMAKSKFFFGDTGLELQPLLEGDAAAFLERLIKRKVQQDPETEAALTIARRLDGLPLAITQIAAIIRRRDLLLGQFLELHKEDVDLFDLHNLRIGPRRGYEYSLASVWALGDLDPAALSLLNVISMLDPEYIQEEILTGSLGDVEPLDYPTTKKEYHETLPLLTQSSLVQRNPVLAELRIHRLVQDVARANMQKVALCEEKVFELTVQLVSSVWPFITRGSVGRAHKVDRWRQCAKLFPHISRLLRIYRSIQQRNSTYRARTGFADLLNEAGWYQFERTNPHEATPLLDLAQSICEESSEDTIEQLALIHGSRTWVAALTHDAEKSFFHAKIRLELEQTLFERSGKATANLAAAYNDLGVAYSMNKLYSKAIPLLIKSKEVRSGLPGFQKDWLYNPLYHLGLAAWHHGQNEEAADILLGALHDREEALGVNDTQSTRLVSYFFSLNA